MNNDDTSEANDLCDDLTAKLTRRNKLIKMEDKSVLGRETVAEYEAEGTGANTARTPDTETKVKDAIKQGLQKIFPQVKKNLVDLFESLPHFLANSTESNTNKSYMNYFTKWQK